MIAPITAVEDTLAGYGELSSITVEATSKDAVAEAEAQITQILDERHEVSEGINVVNQGSIIEASSSSESVFTTLLIWVAVLARAACSGPGVPALVYASIIAFSSADIGAAPSCAAAGPASRTRTSRNGGCVRFIGASGMETGVGDWNNAARTFRRPSIHGRESGGLPCARRAGHGDC